MHNGDSLLHQAIAEQGVLVPVEGNALVERNGFQHFSVHDEIVGHKRLVGVLATLRSRMALATGAVGIPQMVFPVVALSRIHSPTAHHAGPLPENLRIARKKALGRQRIAVKKKQIVKPRILQEQIPDSCTADIPLQLNVSAHAVQQPVGLAVAGVRTVVDADNLALHAGLRRLVGKQTHGVAHFAVVYGNADGNHVSIIA